MKRVIGFLVASIVLFILACNTAGLVEFRPVYANSENEYYTEENYPSDFVTNLQQVLHYYGIEHQIKNKKIFIESSIYNNKELMFNYTNKAMDEEWLQQH